jgi:hypothetical protein
VTDNLPVVTNNPEHFRHYLDCVGASMPTEQQPLFDDYEELLDSHCLPWQSPPHEDGTLVQLFDAWGGK